VDVVKEDHAERVIRATLSNGIRMTWFPTHVPINQQQDEILNLIWEQEDGKIFTLGINLKQVVVLEMTMKPEDQQQEIIDFIKEAK
jgi:hypothetical protein